LIKRATLVCILYRQVVAISIMYNCIYTNDGTRYILVSIKGNQTEASATEVIISVQRSLSLSPSFQYRRAAEAEVEPMKLVPVHRNNTVPPRQWQTRCYRDVTGRDSEGWR